MVFTTDDYKKIQKWLLDNAIKDSEFNEAVTPLTGSEQVPILQNGLNSRIILKDLVNLISLLGVTDLINLTEAYSKSYITLLEAINLVPFAARKIGLVITFLDDNKKWRIFQFLGYSLELWDNTTLWIDILKQSSLGGGSDTPDIGGDVIVSGDFIPDEEDLTAVVSGDKVIVKFKDRTPELDARVGKSKVLLRAPKSLYIGDSVLLKLELFQLDNCIYLIRYKYDLLGETLIIPENCVLEFDGGSISNGTIVLNNTSIYGNAMIDTNILGTVNQSTIYLKWFSVGDTRISQVLNLGGFENLVVDFNYTASQFNISIPLGKRLLFVNSIVLVDLNISENSYLFHLSLGSSVLGLNVHISSSVLELIRFCSDCEIRNINIEFTNYTSDTPVVVLNGSGCELLRLVTLHNIYISGYRGPYFTGIYLNIVGSLILVSNVEITDIICTPSKGSAVLALTTTSCIYLYKDTTDSAPSTCVIRDCIFEENYVHSLLGEVNISDSLGIAIVKGGSDVILNFYSTKVLIESCRFINCFQSDISFLSMSATVNNCISISKNIPNHSMVRGSAKKTDILNSSVSTTGYLIVGDVVDINIENIKYSSTSTVPFISGALLENVKVVNSDLICSGPILDYNNSILNFHFQGCTMELTGGFDISSTQYRGHPVIFNDCSILIKFSQGSLSSYPVKRAQFHHCDFYVYSAYKSGLQQYIFKLLPASNLLFKNNTFTVNGLGAINIIYGDGADVSADSIYIEDMKITNNGSNAIKVLQSTSHISSIIISDSNFSASSLISYDTARNYLTSVMLKDIVLQRNDTISIKAKSQLVMYANNIRSEAVEDFMRLSPIIDIRESNITNVRLNHIYGGVLADSYTNVDSSLDGGVFYFKEKDFPVTLSTIRDHIAISNRSEYNYNIDGTDSNKIVIV